MCKCLFLLACVCLCVNACGRIEKRRNLVYTDIIGTAFFLVVTTNTFSDRQDSECFVGIICIYSLKNLDNSDQENGINLLIIVLFIIFYSIFARELAHVQFNNVHFPPLIWNCTKNVLATAWIEYKNECFTLDIFYLNKIQAQRLTVYHLQMYIIVQDIVVCERNEVPGTTSISPDGSLYFCLFQTTGTWFSIHLHSNYMRRVIINGNQVNSLG